MNVVVANSLAKNTASAREMLREPLQGYDKDNLFAKIVRGEIPSYKVSDA
jgi:hypothetical protein